ncbi:MAG: zinc ribbon domain-containing protein [Christensenellaceae bacterium]|jgi:hypothetical protein|nr:zinc ribbon domain-containing protein [Christensenellaceae bacterium]
MLCSNCGKQNDNGTIFCVSCGAKLPEAEVQPVSSYVVREDAPRKPLGVGDFILMELLARIPLVNLIMFCVWGFSSDTEPNRKNWAISRLIWIGIGIALSVIFGFVLVAIAGAAYGSLSNFPGWGI